MRARHYANTLAALVIASGASGASGGCEPRTRRTPDDTVVIAIEAAMTTADSRYAVTSYDNKLSKLVASGLTAVDSDTMVPRLELAAKVDVIDPRTIDVTLRDDAKFSDGSPVLAADVAGTYGNVLAPDSDSASHKTLTDRFTGVEAVAPRLVRFHLRAPLATFMSDIDFGILKFHDGTPEHGHTIGAGPYVLREITSTAAYLDTNPFYFGDKPKVPHVEVKFVRDSSARVLMLVGGSADLIQNGVRPDLVDAIADRPRVHLVSSPSVILTYLMMNNADPVLKDRRVRQAIALALDRRAIIKAKFSDRAVLATGLIAPMHWCYTGDVPRYDHDLARAKQLLDEAGLRDPDGDGPLPRIHFVYKTSSDAFRLAIARVIAAQLAEVGIEVEVRSFEFATFFADIKKGLYQLATMQTDSITEPDYYFTYFNSSWIPNDKNPDGFNRWRYKNAEVDRLTTLGREELDRDKRKAIYADVQRLVAEDVPVIPLWHEDNLILTNVDLEGYRVTPNARLIGLVDARKTSH